MSGLTLTRKGRQWAEKRGRSSKPFQDQSRSTLFGLELPLPPPRLSHVWAPTLPFNSGGKTRQTHRAQTFLHSAGQQLARRPGGCGAPQGAKVYQSLFVEPPGADVLALGLGRVGQGRARQCPGTKRNASSNC